MKVNLPLGLVVKDVDGHRWVYVGYTTSSVNTRKHHFVREIVSTWVGQCWEYRVVNRETAVRKFPELAFHWPEKAEEIA